MKKIVKWTIYIASLVLIGALTLGLSVFPEQTQSIIDKIMEYANTPVAIAGISTTIGGIVGYILVKYVFSNTKFGRKELESMNKTIDAAKEDISSFKQEAINEVSKYKEAINEKVTEYREKVTELQEMCDNKVSIMLQEFEDLQETLLNSLQVIPNKKVQEIVAQYKATYDARKEEIINKTIDTKDYIDKIKAEYEAKFQELLEKVEVILNEKTIDSETTQE